MAAAAVAAVAGTTQDGFAIRRSAAVGAPPHAPRCCPPAQSLGATGSRLLSGDSSLARSLESYLASAHGRPAALLFGSGYDANLSVLSSIPLGGDAVVMDELCHNSIVMGVRMGRARGEDVRKFRHNDVADLDRVLRDVVAAVAARAVGGGGGRQVLVVVESVYSMDGDVAPLRSILDVSAGHGASVIVDEAHGLGVYGRTNPDDLILPKLWGVDGGDSVAVTDPSYAAKGGGRSRCGDGGGTGVLASLGLEGHPSLLCSVHTFGKAAGCHGAAVLSSPTVSEYLVNYARPFVYSTAPPPHSLVTIRCAYETMMGEGGGQRRGDVFRLVELFRREFTRAVARFRRGAPADAATSIEPRGSAPAPLLLLPSPSPIQAVMVPGNDRCVALARNLGRRGLELYPIRSPTVPPGEERLRIILHSHNTGGEVLRLIEALVEAAAEMGLLTPLQRASCRPTGGSGEEDAGRTFAPPSRL